MTRLELVRKLRIFAGIAAGSTGNGPSTTIAQTGEYGRLVDWIDNAWNLMQLEHRWGFLWESATITIAAGTNLTAGSIPAHRYEPESAWLGTTNLTYSPWARFRAEHPNALVSDGIPSAWSIRPDKGFVVNHKPTSSTDIVVERYKNPVAMAADADEPSLPAAHHMAIVYRALIEYCNFEEAGVSRATAVAKYAEHMTALGLHELPQWEFGDPLA